MKVENNPNNRITPQQTENASSVEKGSRLADGENRPDSLKKRDNFALSEQARLLAKARTALSETPEVRTDQIEHLREQVQSGNYQVPIEQLAKRLLSRLTSL